MSGDPEVIAQPDRLGNMIRTDQLMEWIAYFTIDAERRRGQELEAGAKRNLQDAKRKASEHL